jgi:hypothetical protein
MMFPLVADQVWRRQHPSRFVQQHEVTWDSGPRHGGGGLLLHRSWSADRIKVVVLGFLSCEDKDLLDIDLARVLSSVKAPLVNSTRHLKPGDC